jgi:hypothetical protein
MTYIKNDKGFVINKDLEGLRNYK